MHIPSFSVFPNWPTSKTPLRYVKTTAFSPGSGYFAAGASLAPRLPPTPPQ
eukprot:SAG11_NODE_7209_length_1177_cov_1.912801_1_plen_50_part_10